MSYPYCVYIAAASTPDQIARATACGETLRDAGITITSTWIASVAKQGAGNPREAARWDRRGWAMQCIAEVLISDLVLVLAPPPGVTTRGAWCELAIAWANDVALIVSGDTRQTVFSALGIEYGEDDHALVAIIEEARAYARRAP